MTKGSFHYYTLSLICLFSFLKTEITLAQDHTIDSLLNTVNPLKDTAKVNQLNKISNLIRLRSNLTKALEISLESTALAQRIKYQEGLASSLLEQSWIYYDLTQYDKMSIAQKECKEIYQSLGMFKEAAKSLKVISQYYIRVGYYDSAYVIEKRIYYIFDSLQDKRGKAGTLLSISHIKSLQADDKGALTSLLNALKIYIELRDKVGEGWIYLELGNVNHNLNNFAIAKHYYLKQLNISKDHQNKSLYSSALLGLGNVYLSQKKFDSATFYFKKSLKIELVTNDTYVLGVLYNNLGESYFGQKKYDESYLQFIRSVELCKKINDLEGLIYPIQGLALIFIKKNQLKKADSLLQESLHLCISLAQFRLLSNNYKYTSQLDSARGNYKEAYALYKKGAELEDSLLTEKKTRDLLNIQKSYEVEEKEATITLLNQEHRIKAAQQAKIRLVYLVTIVLAGILIFSLLYTIRLVRKRKKEILEKNETLNGLNANLKDAMNQIEIRQTELENKNEILKDLNLEKDGLISIVAHDLRSPIAKTLGLLQILKLSGKVNEEQQQIIEMMTKVCRDGNNLISDLLEANSISSDDVHNTTIIDLKDFVDEFIGPHKILAHKKNISVHVESNGTDLKLMNDVDYLKRVLDNLVSNAIKFSHPDSTITINYTASSNGALFSVIDLGQGIRKEEMPHLFKKFKRLSTRPTGGESSTGLGLSIVKALVEKMGGTIQVESEFGKGSTFTVSLRNKMIAA